MHKMRGTKIYINFQSKDEYENNLEKKIIYLTNLGGTKSIIQYFPPIIETLFSHF